MVIEVRSLAKSYEDVHALRGLSIDIARGGIVGLLGPNGAGKTTFVEILEGLRPATSGSVKVLGLDPLKSPAELRRRLGVQLQQTEFPEALTVDETFRLFGSFYPKTLEASRVLEAVSLSDKRKAPRRSGSRSTVRLNLPTWFPESASRGATAPSCAIGRRIPRPPSSASALR